MSELKAMWQPSQERSANSNLARFAAKYGLQMQFNELHTWSIEQPEQFWNAVSEFCEIKYKSKWNSLLKNNKAMPGAVWCDGATLNFAENLLAHGQDQDIAITCCTEGEAQRCYTYAQLRQQVASVAAFLKKQGVTQGSRVAAVAANVPETIIGMLATASLGAIWSSCSPDFGVDGILDRFAQIDPTVLFASPRYQFKRRWVECQEKITALTLKLTSVKAVIELPYHDQDRSKHFLKDSLSWNEVAQEQTTLEFTHVPFNAPLYIMFSSGTTGKPKCIVHSVGGTLWEQAKELILHTDLQRNDTLFYQTTCGWMMWNWMVPTLMMGAKIVLFDGSPLESGGRIIFDLIEKEKVSIFGTSAKFLALIQKEGLKPIKSHTLSSLRSILSTGSPLLPESFDYVYRDIKNDLCLSSIAGGTDILGCFTLGQPFASVFRGETQSLSLGLDVAVFNEQGKRIVGEKGELVCCAPFPSMPIGFWGDEDGSRYHKAYFERFKNVWHHGDYVAQSSHGGLIYYGRSDAVLNPGGVRIGSSEIYRQVEKLSEIVESVVVGQDWEGDVRIVLFVRLASGISLDETLIKKIKQTIRDHSSPFHIPKIILSVSDIPRTRSGKIAELAVRDVIHGRTVNNVEALANPECLTQFANRAELQ